MPDSGIPWGKGIEKEFSSLANQKEKRGEKSQLVPQLLDEL